MAYKIRTVKPHEYDQFQRFLERCYKQRRGFFRDHYPELYRPDQIALSCFQVIEQDGKIVSHLGLFPIRIVSFKAEITVGGVGGIATLPKYRGKGHMTKLLSHASVMMKERGWPLSVLWGDRQRYCSFGWEVAGLKYSLTITRRALTKANVEPSRLSEVSAKEALPTVQNLQGSLPMRVERSRSFESLSKSFLNRWISDDGYIISGKWRCEPLQILEVVSATGREKELIMGVIDRYAIDCAVVDVNAFDHDRFERLFQAASEWALKSEGQFRIINLAGFLKPFTGLLADKAKSLTDFDMTIGLRHENTVDSATLEVRNGNLEIMEGKKSRNYLELAEREGVRLLLGPCFAPPKSFQSISSLFPIPLHIPVLDEV